MPSFDEVSPHRRMRPRGTPAAPLVFDVRLPEDFALDPALVPTARREACDAPSAPSDRRVVCVCRAGRRIGHGAAASRRAGGVHPEVLTGGMEAWRGAGLPTVPVAAIPGALRVTRHRPKIDRIACPWSIRRFKDPDARVFLVHPREVEGDAERLRATPFDVEGVTFSRGGPACTFDTVIARFEPAHPALDALATVVRAADTGRHDQAPEAAGLLAISVGPSRAHRRDPARLDAGMGLYDALHRRARDGRDEGHDRPADRAA